MWKFYSTKWEIIITIFRTLNKKISYKFCFQESCRIVLTLGIGHFLGNFGLVFLMPFTIRRIILSRFSLPPNNSHPSRLTFIQTQALPCALGTLATSLKPNVSISWEYTIQPLITLSFGYFIKRTVIFWTKSGLASWRYDCSIIL